MRCMTDYLVGLTASGYVVHGPSSSSHADAHWHRREQRAQIWPQALSYRRPQGNGEVRTGEGVRP